MSLTFELVTLFPELLRPFAQEGLIGKACQDGLLRIEFTDPRDFTEDVHRSVDDAPFGGGAGMLMTPGPVVAALEAIAERRGAVHTIMVSPSGARFDQAAARRLSALPRIAVVCGRYEGIDDRVRESFVDECFSIGDYVLNGGEAAAAVMLEAIGRLVPGVLGNAESIEEESFAAGGLLEAPSFTRPADFRGLEVPSVLRSGDHGAITAWRERAALARTWAQRPDLRLPPPPAAGPWWLVVDGRRGPAEITRMGAAAPWGTPFPVGPRVEGFRGGTALRDLRKAVKRRDGSAPLLVGVDPSRRDALGSMALRDWLQIRPGPVALLLDRAGLPEAEPDAWYAPTIDLAFDPAIVDVSQPAEAMERFLTALGIELGLRPPSGEDVSGDLP